MSNTALLIIDVQNDFLPPNGSLAVPAGEEVVPGILELVDDTQQSFDIVVLSRDWHPANHISFKNNGGIWPSHCIQDSEGAKFDDKLARGLAHLNQEYIVVSKGNKTDVESYSAFLDEQGEPNNNLFDILQEKKVKKVTVVGLALDYCVKHSALDSQKLGFDTTVITALTRAVDPTKIDKVKQELLTGKVTVDDHTIY